MGNYQLGAALAENRRFASVGSHRRFRGLTTVGLLYAGSLAAEVIPISNPSFEAPETPFVSLAIEGWVKNPKPDEFVENDQFVWDQLVGIFKNTPQGSPDHIPNTDGAQGLFLFTVPGAGFSQIVPDTVFEPGRSYTLTAGFIGGGGGMLEGASVRMELFYLSDSEEPLTAASVELLHSVEEFPTTTDYVDRSLVLNAVSDEDPWLESPIGIRFYSTTPFQLAAGFWDIDHVRLSSESPTGVLQSPSLEEGVMRFTLTGPSGSTWSIVRADAIETPSAEWEELTQITLRDSPATITDDNVAGASRFYRAVEISGSESP